MKTKSSTPSRDHRRRPLAIACALLLAGLCGRAAAEQSPRDVVQSTSDEVLAVLADKGLSKEARREKVKAIVLQNVDFDTLSRLVLARNWNQFSPQQQQDFEREFQGHLAATYGRRLDDYHNEKVAIVGDRREPNGDWTVQTKILRGGGSNDISVDYRLRQSNGQWKMIDFIIEQVSLVANFRSQFQEIISSGGPEHLLQVLREKTAKGEELKS
jgi:phospholipid transport system substrate-binding protein